MAVVRLLISGMDAMARLADALSQLQKLQVSTANVGGRGSNLLPQMPKLPTLPPTIPAKMQIPSLTDVMHDIKDLLGGRLGAPSRIAGKLFGGMAGIPALPATPANPGRPGGIPRLPQIPNLPGLPGGKALMRGLAFLGPKLLAVVSIFAAVVTAAAAVVVAFLGIVKGAADVLAEEFRSRLQSGDTNGSTNSLRAMGIGADQIPAMARALRETLAEGGIGTAAGIKLGVGPQNPYGPKNEAELLDKVLQGLAGIGDAGQRRQSARDLGLESLLPQIERLRRDPKAYQDDKARRERIFTPDRMQAGQRLNDALDRLGEAFEMLLVVVGADFIDGLTGLVNILTACIHTFMDFKMAVDDITSKFSWLGDAMSGLSGLGGFLKQFAKFDPNKPDPDANNPLRDNTKAVQDNTSWLRKQGTFGGGKRTRAALPGNLRQILLDYTAVGMAPTLGAPLH